MVRKVSKNKLCYGVAVNDANYPVEYLTIDGKMLCPYYQRWRGILRRVYDSKYHEKYPTYKDVKICDEWLLFSNFKSWMEKQDWEGKVLDKDILSNNGKIYSPETCAFVLIKTNAFIVNSTSNRTRGVHYLEKRNVYRAKCAGLSKKEIFLGDYKTEKEAFEAWKRGKVSVAKELAKIETDPRIICFLTKYTGEFNA